jgi:Repeat of unknown function (DUF5907)
MSIKLSRANSGKPLTTQEYNSDNLIIETAVNALQAASSSNGTVTNVSDVDTDVAELFSTAIANPTTTPVTTYTRVSKAANLVYASATSGGSAKPTFRALVSTDLPTVPLTKGGTGLTSITANKVIRTNNAGDAIIEGAISAGSSKVTVTPTDPNFVIDVDPTVIEINTLAATTKLSIAKGGTGAATAQAAINALSAVSSATDEYVLTKDTATGNAIFKAQAVGITTINGQTGTTVTLDTDDISEGATNLYYTEARVAANTAVALNTAKVTNATHTGDVTGATALTIAANAVTYAKFQAISATKKLIGRITAGAGTAEEIAISGNLAMSSTDLIVRTSKLKTITSNYSVPITEGTILVNGSGLTTTLPDTTTVADGDEFIIKNIAGAATNTVTVFNVGTETIDGSTTYTMGMANDCVHVKYGGSNKWYIISKIVNV